MPDPQSSTGPTPTGADAAVTQATDTPATAATDGAATATDATTQGAQQQDGNSAQSSSAGADGANKDSPLKLEDVVRNAANKSKKGEQATATPAKANGQETATAGEPTTGKPADAEPPFHKHPRWQEQLGKVRDLTTRVEAAEPKAQEWDKVTNFMQVNQLTPEEVAQGFQIMALIKHQPEKALEALAPFIEQMELQTGKRLPADLQTQVNDGRLDPTTAAELTRTRAQAEATKAENERLQQQRSQDLAAQSRVQIQNAVAQWETDIRARDPDYKVKERVVMAHVRAALATERPSTPEAALKVVEAAYKQASEDLAPIVAARRPTASAPTSSQSTTRAQPVPQTLHDVVRLAAAGGTR
jgi:hypothetical protein